MVRSSATRVRSESQRRGRAQGTSRRNSRRKSYGAWRDIHEEQPSGNREMRGSRRGAAAWFRLDPRTIWIASAGKRAGDIAAEIMQRLEQRSGEPTCRELVRGWIAPGGGAPGSSATRERFGLRQRRRARSTSRGNSQRKFHGAQGDTHANQPLGGRRADGLRSEAAHLVPVRPRAIRNRSARKERREY